MNYSNSAYCQPVMEPSSGSLSGLALPVPYLLANIGHPKIATWVSRAYAGYAIGKWAWEKFKPRPANVSYLHVLNEHENWQCLRPCPKNRKAVLPEGIYDMLRADLAQFVQGRKRYDDLGIPWHRGYLLYGKPGSGKTTTVQSLAGELNMDLYSLSLARLKGPYLGNTLAHIRGHSILLLEDIDCAFSATRKQKDAQITLSELLNVLDGATTPDGQIVFMTTNHVEKIDPALCRPGRADVVVEFHDATASQILEITKRFKLDPQSCETLSKEWSEEGITMAAVQERLIRMTHEAPLLHQP